ncbi:LytTR family DNA-binding domain-containing protein [Ferruginibacter sp. HRS2-29]|uniref:LytR/AlgR family response regulator transcription factor n=1 Tax=Ferruginibacter sp. HRS2-29 TaxID=2487334 RepID=UPI0020CECF02|nr:LytTR family DNA-binding domain-containing protein [Ferruginibacter sp. HRS2-29]MCP9750365.1 DNA-binding response regulator [Ferruginibacter sp. HRS2-29]
MQQTYNCIVADDDDIDRITVLSYIKDYPFLNVTGNYASAEEALAAAKKNLPEVLFLDIDMPGMSGLELRRELPDVPVCVFITSYPDYAVESFEEAALDFLVKPFNAKRFDTCIHRARQYLEVRHKAGMLNHTLGAGTIFIKDGHDQVKLQLHEVLYLEAMKDYTSIVTGSKKHCVLSSLGSLLKEDAFKNFIRVHRSYAVQKHFIDKMTSKEVVVKGNILPVGRLFKDALAGLKI